MAIRFPKSSTLQNSTIGNLLENLFGPTIVLLCGFWNDTYDDIFTIWSACREHITEVIRQAKTICNNATSTICAYTVCNFWKEAKLEKKRSTFDELPLCETLRELIKCPVCWEVPLPPLYLCYKGHIVCNCCQARTLACPLCLEHYSSTRCFALEGIIGKCILQCRNTERGCPHSMRGSEVVDHLKICDYRYFIVRSPVNCTECEEKWINFDEYEDHLLKLHRYKRLGRNRTYVICKRNLAYQTPFGETCCWRQCCIKTLDNATFLLQLYATNWWTCAWISLLGPKSDCANFRALLEFRRNCDDNLVQSWQGQVNHFRAEPAKDIFLQGKGLIIPIEMMQMCPVGSGHTMDWFITLTNCRPNGKSSIRKIHLQYMA